jgi:succinylglutamate desuccinylase
MADPRVVGRRRGEAAGPTLIVVGGMHGNEPAGVRAAERVLARLDEAAVPLRGDLLALRGNVRALALGRRYQARDLNRQWTLEALARAEVALPHDDPEAAETRELRAELDAALEAARGPVFALDFHTTSAAGVPFGLIGDTLGQRQLARWLPIPAILGLEEQLDGVLSEYLTARGAVTIAVEGGQHQSPDAAANLEAVMWIALAAAGLVARERLPGIAAAESLLARACAGLPRLIEVLGRHPVLPGDGFVMQPGHRNIGRMLAGELLARDAKGEIRAPHDGVLLMPLYQSQGEDGFFIGREIPEWEQTASSWARRLRVDRLVGVLPGVHREAPALHDANERIVVDPRAASLYPVSFFRWFGFRRVIETSTGLTLQRRVRGAR